jgi:hypothetical protein
MPNNLGKFFSDNYLLIIIAIVVVVVMFYPKLSEGFSPCGINSECKCKSKCSGTIKCKKKRNAGSAAQQEYRDCTKLLDDCLSNCNTL